MNEIAFFVKHRGRKSEPSKIENILFSKERSTEGTTRNYKTVVHCEGTVHIP